MRAIRAGLGRQQHRPKSKSKNELVHSLAAKHGAAIALIRKWLLAALGKEQKIGECSLRDKQVNSRELPSSNHISAPHDYLVRGLFPNVLGSRNDSQRL